MTRDQIENLEQSGAYIEQMFHTLSSIESSTYKDFLENLSSAKDINNISDRITDEVLDEYYEEDGLQQMLIDYSLFGFIAEIRMPKRSNFKFKEDGSFQSCSIHHGIMRSEYVFGFTIDELFEKATKIGNSYSKEQEDKARLEKSKQL